MTGTHVRSRTVAVWLPPGYESGESDHPVLYMHDGHNCFEPRTSYGGADWQLDEVIVGLVDRDRIEAPIVVAPYTDDHRMDEYWIGPTGEAYLAWLADDLKGFIDAEYRTRPERDHTAVMGSSMGGLASFRAIWQRPEVFSMAGCLSPAFLYAPQLAAEVAASAWPSSGVRLYVDNGDDDLDAVLQPAIDDLMMALDECGFVDRGELDWVRDVGGIHHETSWAQRVWRPLEFFFGLP